MQHAFTPSAAGSHILDVLGLRHIFTIPAVSTMDISSRGFTLPPSHQRHTVSHASRVTIDFTLDILKLTCCFWILLPLSLFGADTVSCFIPGPGSPSAMFFIKPSGPKLLPGHGFQRIDKM